MDRSISVRDSGYITRKRYIPLLPCNLMAPASMMTGAYVCDGVASVLIVGPERSLPLEIDLGSTPWVWAFKFSVNGEHIVSSDDQGVQVCRVADGRQVAKMEASIVCCSVAVSHDGKWIAAGTWDGGVFVWDATTYKPV